MSLTIPPRTTRSSCTARRQRWRKRCSLKFWLSDWRQIPIRNCLEARNHQSDSIGRTNGSLYNCTFVIDFPMRGKLIKERLANYECRSTRHVADRDLGEHDRGRRRRDGWSAHGVGSRTRQWPHRPGPPSNLRRPPRRVTRTRSGSFAAPPRRRQRG